MKTPWNLIFPDPNMHAKLKESLRASQRPFFILVVLVNVITFSIILIGYFLKLAWLEPEKDQFVNELTMITGLTALFSGLAIILPK